MFLIPFIYIYIYIIKNNSNKTGINSVKVLIVKKGEHKKIKLLIY